jgi:MFS transporter, AAHS family, benzoate transport protein
VDFVGAQWQQNIRRFVLLGCCAAGQNGDVANPERTFFRLPVRLRSALMPPVPLGARVWNILAMLGLVVVGTSYQGSVPSATMTYIAKEFGNTTEEQSRALAIIRVDVLVSLVVLRLADRFGRRRMLLFTTTVGPILTALCALSPGLVVFTFLQVLGRGMVTASLLLITVIGVEEVPALARTWASGFLVGLAAVGSAIAVGSVAIADSSLWAWRLLYLVPLLSLPAVLVVKKRLPESRRFQTNVHVESRRSLAAEWRDVVERVRAHRRRLVIVSIFFALLAFENTPTRQLQNDFLTNQQGFSSKQVALFSVLTNIPGVFGLLLGGLIGDRFGHRRLLTFTLFGFVVGDAGLFLSNGSAVWAWSVFGSFVGAASIPVCAILSSEVFPTSFRSTANGITTAVSRIGGALGLLVAGALSTVWSRGSAIAFTTTALLVSLALIRFLPETSGRELEILNPEDLSPG